ncbi:MAG: tetratricopeptide repeat protein [Candidatus Gastranaerophilales bacterium]|nr:tetratricopeptide repeat protein [Candidatus Gastranaerophilales bacterium]
MNKKALIIIFSLLYLFATNITFCEEAENNNEKAANLYNEAIDLYGQDKIEKSIDYFIKALELKPDFYEAHYNLAQILMSLNKNDEAIKSLEEIAKIKPEDTENLYNLGKTYFKKGYLSKSFENLKKININAPQYDDAKLLISKIEKRQDELNLEEKIKKHENIIDTQGISKGIELAEFSAPSGAAIDSKGNVYVASFSQNQIHKISIYGQQSIHSKSNLIQGPIGLAIDKDDNIYVANYSANNIVKITSNNIASIFAQINKPYCLIYDLTNNRLYATEQGSNKLIKFDL